MPYRLGRVVRSSWTIGLCSAAAAALVAAFVWGPAAILRPAFPDYADVDRMSATLTSALNVFLSEGQASLPPELGRLEHYWFRWHAVKVVICVAMWAAWTTVAAACWTRCRDASGRRATLFGMGAAVAAAFAALAAWLLAINAQSTAMPLVALLPLASTGGLTAVPRPVTATQTPATTELLAEVSCYHWCLALGASIIAVVSVAGAVRSWRGRTEARVTGRPTMVHSALLTLLWLNAIGGVLVAAYSAASAIDPAGSLNAVLGIG